MVSPRNVSVATSVPATDNSEARKPNGSDRLATGGSMDTSPAATSAREMKASPAKHVTVCCAATGDHTSAASTTDWLLRAASDCTTTAPVPTVRPGITVPTSADTTTVMAAEAGRPSTSSTRAPNNATLPDSGHVIHDAGTAVPSSTAADAGASASSAAAAVGNTITGGMFTCVTDTSTTAAASNTPPTPDAPPSDTRTAMVSVAVGADAGAVYARVSSTKFTRATAPTTVTEDAPVVTSGVAVVVPTAANAMAAPSTASKPPAVVDSVTVTTPSVVSAASTSWTATPGTTVRVPSATCKVAGAVTAGASFTHVTDTRTAAAVTMAAATWPSASYDDANAAVMSMLSPVAGATRADMSTPADAATAAPHTPLKFNAGVYVNVLRAALASAGMASNTSGTPGAPEPSHGADDGARRKPAATAAAAAAAATLVSSSGSTSTPGAAGNVNASVPCAANSVTVTSSSAAAASGTSTAKPGTDTGVSSVVMT